MHSNGNELFVVTHFPMFAAIRGCYARRTILLLRQTNHRTIFVGSEVLLIKSIFLIQRARSVSGQILLCVMVHYHEAKSFCAAFGYILVVFHAKFDPNPSLLVDNVDYSRFRLVYITLNRSYSFDLTKHRI